MLKINLVPILIFFSYSLTCSYDMDHHLHSSMTLNQRLRLILLFFFFFNYFFCEIYDSRSKRERRDGVCRWQRKEMTRRHHHHHRWLLSPPSPSLPSPIARHHHHCWCSIQGRHRHPASDSVVNEKYLNAGSGNDLTEVRLAMP